MKITTQSNTNMNTKTSSDLPPEPDDFCAPAQPELEPAPEPEPAGNVVLGEHHPDLAPVKWVSLAQSKDPIRETLTRIEVQERDGVVRAIATDGRRLHVARVSCLEPGSYKVVKVLKTRVELSRIADPGPFPNWRQVMPDPEGDDREYVSVSLTGAGDKNTSPAVVVAALGVTFHTGLLWDAINLGRGGYNDILILNRSKPGVALGPLLVFHEKHGAKAVIMPVRTSTEATVLESKPEWLDI